MNSQQTTQCQQEKCESMRGKYSPYCDHCVQLHPNFCLSCDTECGTFKYCYPCGLEEKRNYSGKYCKDCRKPCGDFYKCYTCNMEAKKNYKGRFCEICSKRSQAYKYCYTCKESINL